MATAPTVRYVDHEIWIMPLEWLTVGDNDLRQEGHTDFVAMGQLAQAVGTLRQQVKLLGMHGRAYLKEIKGKLYIVFKGAVGARPLQGTRYLRENPKVACFVLGGRELAKDALKAIRIAVFAYVGLEIIKECMMDHFSLARLGINIASDVLQAAISTMVAAGIGAGIMTFAGAAAPVVVVYALVVAIGFATSFFLQDVDSNYKLTNTLISAAMKAEANPANRLHKLEILAIRVWNSVTDMMRVNDPAMAAALME